MLRVLFDEFGADSDVTITRHGSYRFVPLISG